MKHNIVITAADFDDRLHFLVDCTCGETFMEIGCEMIAIPLELIDNMKWEHLAKYTEKFPVPQHLDTCRDPVCIYCGSGSDHP